MKEPKSVPQKIKQIKKLLGKPYHIFYYTPQGRAIFRIEDSAGEHLFWEGPYISAAVESAMEYLAHEIEMGTVVEEKDDKKDTRKKDTKPDETKKTAE